MLWEGGNHIQRISQMESFLFHLDDKKDLKWRMWMNQTTLLQQTYNGRTSIAKKKHVDVRIRDEKKTLSSRI